MPHPLPDWLSEPPGFKRPELYTGHDVLAALATEDAGPAELAALLSPAADKYIETMAQRAQALTVRHFGRTIALYVPLYLSNYCSSGCVYCGFASDRKVPRSCLSEADAGREMDKLKQMGFEEVLLLTGERTAKAGFEYIERCVALAATRFHQVTVEAFPMHADEYQRLSLAGCTGVTLYQETYDPEQYARLHRWGPKRDYAARLDAPERALQAGMRTVGIGALLGLSEPVTEATRLLLHARRLRSRYWRSGISVSFPRVRPEAGGFTAPFPVDDAFLAKLIFAFRICLHDMHLVLSTRERPRFRDGMAGVGISKMSIASRTTVGGYAEERAKSAPGGQFEVSDQRDIVTFCNMLHGKGLQPVFKNWDAAYRDPAPDAKRACSPAFTRSGQRVATEETGERLKAGLQTGTASEGSSSVLDSSGSNAAIPHASLTAGPSFCVRSPHTVTAAGDASGPGTPGVGASPAAYPVGSGEQPAPRRGCGGGTPARR